MNSIPDAACRASIPWCRVDDQAGEETIGDRIRLAYTGLGLTQSKAAERIGVEQPELSRWVTGARTPSAANLRHIIAGLGVTADQLLGVTGVDERGERLRLIRLLADTSLPLDQIFRSPEDVAAAKLLERFVPPPAGEGGPPVVADREKRGRRKSRRA